jgi:hypothetical protein
VERDSRLLKLQEERLGVVERKRRRKGISFPGTKPAVEHGPADPAQVQPPPIASDLSVEGRFSIGQRDLEAKFVDIKRLAASRSETKTCGSDATMTEVPKVEAGDSFNAPDSLDQRRPTLKPGFSGDKLLCIAELEACIQDFSVGQVSETG